MTIDVIIDHTKITSALINFPILVRLSAGSGITKTNITDIFNAIGTQYKKISITDSSNNELYCEVEYWDPVNKLGLLWVKVLVISNTVDTVITLDYYSTWPDNSYVGPTGSIPAQNVWNSGYKAVLHLGQSGNGTLNEYIDSTVNNHHGTGHGVTGSPIRINKLLGGGQKFDGNDDYISIADSNDLSWNPTKALTIEWMYIPTVTHFRKDQVSGCEHYINMMGKGDNPDGWEYVFTLGGMDGSGSRDCKDGEVAFYCGKPIGGIQAGSGTFYLGRRTEDEDRRYIPNTDKIYIAGRMDSSNIYVDSILDGHRIFDVTNFTNYEGRNLSPSNTWSKFHIGTIPTQGQMFEGIIDEVRISNVFRSDAWIEASYYSKLDDLIKYNIKETQNMIPAPFKAALKCNFLYDPAEWNKGADIAEGSGIDLITLPFDKQAYIPKVKAGTYPIALTNVRYAISKGLKVAFQVNMNSYGIGRWDMPDNPTKRAEFMSDFKWLVDNWKQYITYIEMEEPALYESTDTAAKTASKTAWLTTLHREMKAYIKLKAPGVLFTLNFPSNTDTDITKNAFDYRTADNERIFDLYFTQSGNKIRTSPSDTQDLGLAISSYTQWKARMPNTTVVPDANVSSSNLEGSATCVASNSTLFHSSWTCWNQAFWEQLKWAMGLPGKVVNIYHSQQLLRSNSASYMTKAWPLVVWNTADGINPYDRVRKILGSSGTQPTGTLDIRTTPTDATVTFDGTVQAGLTNMILTEVTPSVTHTVTVNKTGYKSETRTVSVSAGLTAVLNIPLILEPTAGSIDVRSNPTGAIAYVDNLIQGLTNVILDGVTPGSHTVKLTKAGYNDFTQVVNVIAGQTAVINATLIGSCVPSWACEVPLNGYEKDGCGNRRPNTNCNPCIPNWQCEVPKNGYEVDGCGNRRANIACNPPPAKGTVNIVSVPPGATVTFNTVPMGAAPFSKELDPDHYAVVASLPGYPDINDQFDIKAGETILKVYTFKEEPKGNSSSWLIPLSIAVGVLGLIKK